MIDHIESLVVATEAEALLTEQNFIKQYKPRFNIRLRDDKSYPYIAISLDEDFPRVYFTRERHRRERAYFGPYSTAKRVRGTLDLLGKIFLFRSCEGPEPGRALAARRASTTTSSAAGRPASATSPRRSTATAIDGVIAFLSGRYRADRARPRASGCTSPPASRTTSRRRSSATACRRCARCSSASASPNERRGHATTRSPSPSTARRPTRRSSRSATACSSDRQSLLPRQRRAERAPATSPRSSCSSTTRARCRSRR